MEPEVLDFQVSLGCAVLYHAIDAVAAYYGLDATELDHWREGAPAHWFS